MVTIGIKKAKRGIASGYQIRKKNKNLNMKSLMLLCLLLCLSPEIVAQNESAKRTVQLLADSELTITGDTNINKFQCGFNTKRLERSKEISFSAQGNKLKFKNAVLILNNEGFDCGNKGINKDFHDLLRTDDYPSISLELIELKVQDEYRAVADIEITIAGKHKNYTLPIEIVDTSINCFTGTLKLNINDFDLKPPKKMFGLIVVKKDIEINFNLNVLK